MGHLRFVSGTSIFLHSRKRPRDSIIAPMAIPSNGSRVVLALEVKGHCIKNPIDSDKLHTGLPINRMSLLCSLLHLISYRGPCPDNHMTEAFLPTDRNIPFVQLPFAAEGYPTAHSPEDDGVITWTSPEEESDHGHVDSPHDVGGSEGAVAVFDMDMKVASPPHE